MDTTNLLVEKQYTNWVYPKPVPDLEEWKAQGHFQKCDPSLHHEIIWPDRAYRSDISILVAGCGTSQSAILAFNNPEASVIGIDLSQTSLDYTRGLKEKHNLKNLELHQMDLHDVAKLGRKFDLIYSTGVLHHLRDPQRGLLSLAQVLADDGVMCLMLYGKYLRLGVYMIQEALSRLGIEQTPAGVDFTRTIISSLPRHHVAQTYIESAALDLVYDGGLVDTFLHTQDRAYTVPEILKLVQDSQLSFQGWCENLLYYPDGYISPTHVAHPKIAALPEEEQWAVIELLMQRIGAHGFLVRNKTDDESRFRINYNSPTFEKMIPTVRFGSSLKEDNGKVYHQRYAHTFPLTPLEQLLYKAVDGKQSISNLLQLHAHGLPEQYEQAMNFFKRMGRLGHLIYSTH